MSILSSLSNISRKKYRWYHGAAILVGLNLAERGLEYLTKKVNKQQSTTSIPESTDKEWYRRERRPVFAPPGKAFPIAWAINNLATIYGNLRVLNMPKATPGRSAFLNLQTASWATYVLFGAAHFGLRSHLNALGLTIANVALNVLSERVAITKLKDEKVAWSLAPTLAWLAVALPTAVTMAAWNKDEFYHTPVLAKPEPEWIKPSNVPIQLSMN
jgi:tryptophan-rich sensory protein